MGLKEDWSFLDKISMGAIATTKVTELLNTSGHRIIELERCSSSNKIWKTKLKRLRVPDLLCINCGRRIESRAKSKLGIIMSDSPVNVLRKWNYGLRDEDLVAFIYCNRDENSHWFPSNELNIFNIGEMRECEEADLTRLGEPKSASEGAERDRRWPSYVPGFSGVVSSIDDGKIKFLKDNGGKQTKPITPGHTAYISPGDRVFENATIVHSIVPTMQDHHCDNRFYDFLADLTSDNLETVYCAVKALSFLPELIDSSIPMLYEILNIEDLENRLKFRSNFFLGTTRRKRLGILSTAVLGNNSP